MMTRMKKKRKIILLFLLLLILILVVVVVVAVAVAVVVVAVVVVLLVVVVVVLLLLLLLLLPLRLLLRFSDYSYHHFFVLLLSWKRWGTKNRRIRVEWSLEDHFLKNLQTLIHLPKRYWIFFRCFDPLAFHPLIMANEVPQPGGFKRPSASESPRRRRRPDLFFTKTTKIHAADLGGGCGIFGKNSKFGFQTFKKLCFETKSCLVPNVMWCDDSRCDSHISTVVVCIWGFRLMDSFCQDLPGR